MLKYINQTRSRLLWLLFLLSAAFFVLFPEVDLKVSALFFEQGFHLKGSPWENLLYKSVDYLLIATVVTVLTLYLVNRVSGRQLGGINGRKTLYLLLVLVIGAGIIVNLVLKNHSGRARPLYVVEFNGSQQFTPAFRFADQCSRNCSFSSGHSAGAFFFLALALLYRRHKPLLLAAFTYGSLVSLARIAAGGHFLSDCVTSFFIMAIITDLFYTLLQPNQPDTKPAPAPA